MYKSIKKCAEQRGSALVEFSLLAGVIIPVGLGMTMLGKLTDLNQTSEQASRYAAWEATVYSRQALVTQSFTPIDERFFQAPGVAIKTQGTAQSHSGQANPLWGKATARAGSMRGMSDVSRVAADDVSVKYRFDTGKAKAARVTGKIAAKAGEALDGFSGNSWGLVADGLLRSSIEVPVNTTAFLLGDDTSCGTPANAASQTTGSSSQAKKTQQVCVRKAGVILADGWGASGDAHTVSRVRSLVPGSTLSKIGNAVGTLLGSTVFPELDPLDKAFGHVDMSVLPHYAK